MCLQNAFNQKLYYASYKKDADGKLTELVSPCVTSPEDLIASEESLCLGAGLELYYELIPEKTLGHLTQNESHKKYPQSKDLAQLCLNQPSEKKSWNSVEPLYLKASEAEEKLKRGELKKALSGQYQ